MDPRLLRKSPPLSSLTASRKGCPRLKTFVHVPHTKIQHLLCLSKFHEWNEPGDYVVPSLCPGPSVCFIERITIWPLESENVFWLYAVKGLCATLVLCGRGVLSECANKPCTKLEAARKHWESDGSQLLKIPSSTRFERSFVYLRTSSWLVFATLISYYQKSPIIGKQGIFAVAKRWRCTGSFEFRRDTIRAGMRN